MRDVEEVLFGKIRCGTGVEAFGYIETPVSVFTSDYTHRERSGGESSNMALHRLFAQFDMAEERLQYLPEIIFSDRVVADILLDTDNDTVMLYIQP